MKALLLGEDGTVGTSLSRSSLHPGAGGPNEKWLQELLFAHPELLAGVYGLGGAQPYLPICRELTMPTMGRNVFLDILGITPTGRLVLIETKLWRNPQARREVVAQILEYATLLRQWSFSDLTARLKSQLGWTCENPLYKHVVRHYPDIDEATFVDSVAKSLRAGDFALLIVGDGIRSDVEAITAHLNARGGLTAELALVEIQLWADDAGRTVVLPFVTARTEVIQQRVVVADDGRPLSFAADEQEGADADTLVQTTRSDASAASRAFWDRFIAEVTFSHPDQPAPRHGGRGWVKMDMPGTANGMVAFRTQADEAGLFARYRNDDGRETFSALEDAETALEASIGAPLVFRHDQTEPFQGTLSLAAPKEMQSEDDLIRWLCEKADLMSRELRMASNR